MTTLLIDVVSNNSIVALISEGKPKTLEKIALDCNQLHSESIVPALELLISKSTFNYLDIVSIVAPIGIFFGRIANFINSELYGTETSLPWAVKFIRIDDLYRHPSQLYEAIFEGLILFLILIYFRKKGFMRIPGLISGLFLVFYSFFRFIIEFFRVPDQQIGYLFFNLTMGQIISIIFLLIGSYLIFEKNEFKKKY